VTKPQDYHEIESILPLNQDLHVRKCNFFLCRKKKKNLELNHKFHTVTDKIEISGGMHLVQTDTKLREARHFQVTVPDTKIPM